METFSNSLAVRFSSILLLFFIALYGIDKLSIAQKWLSVNSPINAKLLIVEGWIPPYYLDDIVNEFNKGKYENLLITGFPLKKDLKLYRQGAIIFKNIPANKSGSKQSIKISMRGSYANGEYTKCKILKNDSLISFGEYRGDSTVYLSSYFNPSDSLVLQFTNDAISPDRNQDRNLVITNLTVDSADLPLYSPNIWFSIEKHYFSTGFTSNSEGLYNSLIKMGIPKNKLAFVVNHTLCLSKTYNLALGAINWMRDNNYSKANIITLSFHSRRTLLSFKKAGKEMNFGTSIIKASTYKKRTIKEIMGNLMIWITPKFILELELFEHEF